MKKGLCCTLWSLNVLVIVIWSSWTTSWHLQVGAVPAEAPEYCDASACFLKNAYGEWNDRSPCKAVKVVYPGTEEEIVKAVADAVRSNQKVKVATAYSHSIPKLACPGTDVGVIISSKNFTSIVNVDKTANTITAQSGITMRALVDAIASHGLSLYVAPFFDAVTLGGVIANSVHGSSFWGKGGAVHEYVLSIRLVTPATAAQGYATVREFTTDDPDLNAVKVNLGVLGMVSTVTLQLEPEFKRNVTYKLVHGDNDFTGAKILEIGRDFQYPEIIWYPALHQVVYKLDNRASVTTPGNGRNNYFGMQPQFQISIEALRIAEELAEATRSRESKCLLAHTIVSSQQAVAYGFELQSEPQGIPNPGIFPVIGKQNYMMNAGGCQRDLKPLFYCAWDQRIGGMRFFEDSAALPVQNITPFVDDIKLLRDRAPAHSLCDLDMYSGIMFRFTKKTGAYLGTAQQDSIMVDFTWSRGNDGITPRLDMDVFAEIEQLAFDKHGARPHWGKNRNAPFADAKTKYPNLEKFLAVMKELDSAGVFSSEWSDAILGLGASAVASDAPFCAIEGNCKCSRDEHCAPAMQSFCRPGLVYPHARVCRTETSALP